jgi:hypothetical protein
MPDSQSLPDRSDGTLTALIAVGFVAHGATNRGAWRVAYHLGGGDLLEPAPRLILSTN